MLSIYPSYAQDICDGKDLEFHEGIDSACEQIHEACDGLGTDEDKLNDVLGKMSCGDRYLTAHRYKQLHDKSLKDLIKSETSGDYGKMLQLVALPVDEAEAAIVREATKGAGTTEKLLYPVLLGRSVGELEILKKAFYRLYEEDLLVTLDSDLSGDLKQLITCCLQELEEPYDESVHTAEKAEEIAKAIYDAGQGKWGTDESAFFKLMFTTPAELFPQVDRIYAENYGYTLEKAIEKEFGGKCEDALVHYIEMVLKPYEAIAKLFESTMKGFGTDEYRLATAMVRYHHVLPQVKEAYEKLYERTLRDRIHGETSGKFRDLLMAMCNQ